MVKTLESPWLHPLSLSLGAVVGMGCWALFFTLVLEWELFPALLNGALLTGTWLFPFLLVHNLLLYYFPRGWNKVYLYIVGWIMGGAWWISYDSLRLILLGDYKYLFSDTLLMSLGLFGTVFLQGWILVRTLWQQVEEQTTLKEMENQALRIRKEAELHHIRQQLQPHFLFNALNSINALAGSDPVRTREMVQQLSAFLRNTLQHDQQELIPLELELERIHHYFSIEQTRFGERLQLDVQIEDGAKPLLIPALALQPLVENAVKHGWTSDADTCYILLQARHAGNYLQIEIKNPRSGEPSRKGTGFGLESLQRRLFLLFSRKDLLETEVTEDIFSVQLKIPQAA